MVAKKPGNSGAELPQCVARRISDRQVLNVINRWLKTPAEERDENGKRRTFGPHRFKSFQIVSSKDGHWYLGASASSKSMARLRWKVRELLRPGEVGRWGGAARPAEPGVGGLVGLLFSWDRA